MIAYHEAGFVYVVDVATGESTKLRGMAAGRRGSTATGSSSAPFEAIAPFVVGSIAQARWREGESAHEEHDRRSCRAALLSALVAAPADATVREKIRSEPSWSFTEDCTSRCT